jgi:hypothetical protein
VIGRCCSASKHKLNGGHNTHLRLVHQEHSLRQIILLNLSFSRFHSCKELESGSVKLGLSWDVLNKQQRSGMTRARGRVINLRPAKIRPLNVTCRCHPSS